MRFLYDIAFIIFALAYLPFFILRRKYHKGIVMRFGILPEGVLAAIKGKKVIWVHAVSVGEAQAAKPLVEALEARFPDAKILFSTVTKTGNELAKRLFGAASVIYLPFDISFAVRGVLDKVKPIAMIILETEIWPNLLFGCRYRRIPVFFVNGRISGRAFRRYGLVKPLLKPVLSCAALFLMQSDEDAGKIKFLGAPYDRVKVTGNLKFDATVQPSELLRHCEEALRADEAIYFLDCFLLRFSRSRDDGEALLIRDAAKLFIAGSTHPGEEEVVLRAFKNLKPRHRNLMLLLAPRHVERTPQVEKLAESFGLKSIRFSSLAISHQPSAISHDVIILDQIGFLAGLYRLADVVFVGGSLVPVGGHNVIEPALFGKPILTGRHTFNFKDIMEEFAKENAMLEAGTDDFERLLEQLLSNEREASEMGRRAKRIVDRNKGAVSRCVEYMSNYLA